MRKTQLPRGCAGLLPCLAAAALALACANGPAAGDGALPFPDEPTPSLDGPALSAGFTLGPCGSLASEQLWVLSGTASVVGSYSGPERYSCYLETNPELMPLRGGTTYLVEFSYRVLADADRGFEVLFLSDTAASRDQWLPSLTIEGPPGSSGTASLRGTILDYPDYRVYWNIVGRGSIAVDDIRISELGPEGPIAVATEGAEPKPVRLAQRFLPRAYAGQAYGAHPAVYGGRPPYSWSDAYGLPKGLSLNPGGILKGSPRDPGSYRAIATVTDADGKACPVSLSLEVLPAPPGAGITLNGIRDGSRSRWAYAASDESFANPLRGLRPELDIARDYPWASLGRVYLPWNLLERSEGDGLDRIMAVSDRVFGDVAAYNVKVIPRVYLLWPPRDRYWPVDLRPGDFQSAAFRERLVRLVQRLGQAWNGDPRVAYIEMGIIGYWGEHHHPGFNPDEGGLPRSMEKLVGDAFAAAFPDTPVMHRNPRDFTAYGFGLHWDVFGSFDRGWYSNDSSLMKLELQTPLLKDRWLSMPRGGEIDPTFLGEKDWSGSSQEAMVLKHAQRLASIARDLHWNHLSVANDVDTSKPEILAGLSLVDKALGYRFVLESASLPLRAEAGSVAIVELTLSNRGSSPMYASWPLEISVLDPVTHLPLFSAIIASEDTRSWIPGARVDLKLELPIPAGFARGSYPVAIAILDPAGMVPSVRFANANYWNGGRSPLGVIGIGMEAGTLSLTGFHDLAGDRSLYYLP